MTASLIIHGAAGRMGKRLIALALESGFWKIVGAVDHPEHPDIGKDAALLAGCGNTGVVLSGSLDKKADVMIDFSLPGAAAETIAFCEKTRTALVMGTTGLSEAHMDLLRKAGQKIPIVQATNMSLGMNLLFSLVGRVAKSLGEEYDIEIVEAHHRHKKDAPSGSALSLAQSICEQTGRKYPDVLVHGREGKEALRQKGTIGMHAIRAGDIVGQHSVIYSTQGETITLSHSAHSRDTFARGALSAARWLLGKAPGLYSMQDVLGLR
ncbi:MAG: 4-hydroxy-tetrahydrodipicolinate reductase [Anaerohalosphaeraceae bacterium]